MKVRIRCGTACRCRGDARDVVALRIRTVPVDTDNSSMDAICLGSVDRTGLPVVPAQSGGPGGRR